MSKSSVTNPSFFWKLLEVGFVILFLGYFMLYDRNTLTDFIVLSGLCLLVFLFNRQVGIRKIKKKPFSKIDIFLAVFSLLTFFGAWIYGIYEDKVNWNTFLISIAITITYFYYAFIQHFLAQRYLAVRMFNFSERIKFGKTHLLAALMTGLIFSLLHIIYPHLILPSAFIGILFTYYYLTTGRLWGVVCAHAIMASSILYWCLDDNPFTEIIDVFQ